MGLQKKFSLPTYEELISEMVMCIFWNTLYVCMYAFVCVCVRVHMCVCACVCVCVYIHAHVLQ
jgi:hypothetical protein